MAALHSLLDKDRRNSDSGKTALSPSSASVEAPASRSGGSDSSESPTLCQLSPDSTAGSVDWNLTASSHRCRLKPEDAVLDENLPGDTRISNLFGNFQISSRCDARALVTEVYRQLCEAKHKQKMVSSLPTVVSDNSAKVVPEFPVVVDQVLLDLAAEARQIPVADSEREALVEQVTWSIVDAHLKTCYYTQEIVDAGIQRHLQVCHCYSYGTAVILAVHYRVYVSIVVIAVHNYYF